MSHRARILTLHSRAEIEREMRRVGSEGAGVQIMAPKAEALVVRLEEVRGKAASILKQLMLSAGGDACVARSVAAFDDTPAPVLLVGDRRHFSRIMKSRYCPSSSSLFEWQSSASAPARPRP